MLAAQRAAAGAETAAVSFEADSKAFLLLLLSCLSLALLSRPYGSLSLALWRPACHYTIPPFFKKLLLSISLPPFLLALLIPSGAHSREPGDHWPQGEGTTRSDGGTGVEALVVSLFVNDTS